VEAAALRIRVYAKPAIGAPEHPGTEQVRLRLDRSNPGRLEVTVSDDGTWRPPPADPGFRGRGVQLMHRLADRATITHSPGGTSVALCWETS
jgi:two-component sensor histidine kinase